MRFLPDARLYACTDDCLAYLRGLPEPAATPGEAAEPLPVHFFWQGEFTAKPALCLKSFFATQDPARFPCWLWLDHAQVIARARTNPHLAPFLPLIQLRHFDLAAAAADTPCAGQPWVHRSAPAAAVSDLARLLILHHHGGIYSDLDALFLRDLRPLLALAGEAEFGFQWSYLPRGTNAFCRCRRHGPAVRAWLDLANLARSAHPAHLLDYQRHAHDVLMLPAAFFSPLWLHFDRRDRSAAAPFDRFTDFFRRFRWWFPRNERIASQRDLFPGAFTYHWHGCWRAPEHRDSYAGIVAAALETELARRQPALAALPPFGGAS